MNDLMQSFCCKLNLWWLWCTYVCFVLILIFTLCAMPCLHAAVTQMFPKLGSVKYIWSYFILVLWNPTLCVVPLLHLHIFTHGLCRPHVGLLFELFFLYTLLFVSGHSFTVMSDSLHYTKGVKVHCTDLVQPHRWDQIYILTINTHSDFNICTYSTSQKFGHTFSFNGFCLFYCCSTL